jgi:hypothetical protein
MEDCYKDLIALSKAEISLISVYAKAHKLLFESTSIGKLALSSSKSVLVLIS